MFYKIKNWGNFQHYKDRCPPWIKLHHSLLTSEAWVMCNDASRALAIACMFLASRNEANDGTFNGDPAYVQRFGYLNSEPDFTQLIQYGFIQLSQDASTELPECDTEKSREEKIRKENTHSTTRAGALCKQLRQIGIEAAPHQPQLLEMLNKHTDEQIMAVAEIAVKRKPGERVSIGYLVPMLADAGKPVKKTPPPEDFSKRDYGKGIVNL